MSDVKKDTIPLEKPEVNASQSRLSRFNQWLRAFGKQKIGLQSNTIKVGIRTPVTRENRDNASLMEEKSVADGNLNKEEPDGVEIQPSRETENRPTRIATFIEKEIERKGLKPPDYQEAGVSEFYGTNEKVSPALLHKLKTQEQAPDGYVIGIGVGNIFSLLDTFPQDKPPKGIVMINVDPRAVEDAKKIVDQFREEGEVKKDPIEELTQEEYERRVYREGNYNVDTENVMKRHAALLRKLAKEDNIAVIQQDFLNPELIEILSCLPQLNTSNNIVYLSNIADWVYRASSHDPYELKFKPEDFAKFQFLSALQAKPPYKTYFADSLQVPLKYKVRIGSETPRYYKSNFLELNRPQTLSEDQIEGIEETSVNYLDYRNASVDLIQQKYNELHSNPGYQRLVQEWTEIVQKNNPAFDYERDNIPL